ncbi:MAG: hypothetical protein LBV23_01045 [Deltaproteobacteria bacterium]|jgi:hypothetical protein|nr:hypothetical protein [Deltaproteobacteria bacterium]
MESMKEIMSKLGLTVNEEKTKVESLPAGAVHLSRLRSAEHILMETK